MNAGRFLFFIAVGVTLLFAEPAPAEAQGVSDELKLEWFSICRDDPDSSNCICAPVALRVAVPIGAITYEPSTGIPLYAENVGGDVSNVPRYDSYDRMWIGEAQDLQIVENSWFKRHCALAFFREDLTRAWYIAVAIGTGFLAMSFAWSGVVYMQESASGGDLAQVRVRLFRIIMGLLVLGMAFIFYETVISFLFNSTDYWTGDRAIYYAYLDER